MKFFEKTKNKAKPVYDHIYVMDSKVVFSKWVEVGLSEEEKLDNFIKNYQSKLCKKLRCK